MIEFLDYALLVMIFLIIIGLPLMIFLQLKRSRHLIRLSEKSSETSKQLHEQLIQETRQTNKLLETLIKTKRK